MEMGNLNSIDVSLVVEVSFNCDAESECMCSVTKGRSCKGNPDEKFVVLQASRKGHFINSAGTLPVRLQ